MHILLYVSMSNKYMKNVCNCSSAMKQNLPIPSMSKCYLVTMKTTKQQILKLVLCHLDSLEIKFQSEWRIPIQKKQETMNPRIN